MAGRRVQRGSCVSTTTRRISNPSHRPPVECHPIRPSPRSAEDAPDSRLDPNLAATTPFERRTDRPAHAGAVRLTRSIHRYPRRHGLVRARRYGGHVSVDGSLLHSADEPAVSPLAAAEGLQSHRSSGSCAGLGDGGLSADWEGWVYSTGSSGRFCEVRLAAVLAMLEYCVSLWSLEMSRHKI